MNLSITHRDTLVRILREHNISTESWGKGKAKTLEDLFKEILEGETTLCVESGNLLRYVRVACVDVFYRKDDSLLRLKEEKQVFKADGHERQRNLETSVQEKLLRDEDEVAAARRGVNEELGFKKEEIIYLEPKYEHRETIESPSYPGLSAKFHRYFFRVFLGAHLFKPEGYVEVGERKTTYFVWVEVGEI